MTSRRNILVWLVLSLAISVAWGYSIERSKSVGLVDFRAIYYGARAVLDHQDPYQPDEYLAAYRREGGALPTDASQSNVWRAVPICVNLPTTLFLVVPFALIGWGPAHLLWMILIPMCLLIAAWLACDLARDYGGASALILSCIVLANSELLLQLGNGTGIAASLCVAAVWCFWRNKFVWAGILCLSVALALKPQEVALIWLYFLLAGTVHRKRALVCLGLVAVFVALSLLWISTVSPHWLQEWHSNVAATSVHGDLNDPGPTSIGNMKLGMTVSLQSVLSYIRDDPGFYNLSSYLICLPLIGLWIVTALRAGLSQRTGWLALASMSALSMLPVYHRQYDVKLLFLMLPACAMLCREGGTVRRYSLLTTAAAILFTSDIPVAMLLLINKAIALPQNQLSGKLVSVLLARTPTLVLFASSVFYLWMFAQQVWRDSPVSPDPA
ncbi:MAG TPA: glycosyltransferase family 87 protein [Terracidiphilus sp.]|jgi:hypothetical protein